MSSRNSLTHDLESDYDYPSAKAKPILAQPYDSPPQLPRPAKRLSLIRRVSSGRRDQPIQQTMSAYVGSTNGSNDQQKNAALKKNFLSIVLPTPQSTTFKANGVYYDIPKNTPVNPIFAIGRPDSPDGVLYQNTTTQPASNRRAKPMIPPKSSRILSMMCTTSPPVSSGISKSFINNTAVDRNKCSPTEGRISLSTPLPLPSPTRVKDDYSKNNFNDYLTLNRKSTSKALPTLPGKSITPAITTAASISPVYSRPINKINGNIKVNDYMTEVVQGYKQISLEEDDEDDYDQCDYEYDYVCLESTKRLDREQECIRSQLEPRMQQRYERMVLTSGGNDFTLVNLEKRATNSNLSNANIRSQILLRYRQIYVSAFETYRQWTKLSIEIINRAYEPAVFFNFLKHILLSAQMLITIVSSLKRHVRFEEGVNLRHQAINTFSTDFMDRLKVIVVRAKRTNTVEPDVNRNLAFKVRQDVICSIQESLDTADALKVSLNCVT